MHTEKQAANNKGDLREASEQKAEGELVFPDEARHLQIIEEKLEIALQEAERQVNQLDKEYMETMLYMAQNRSDIDPHEMFQSERALQQIDSSGVFAVETRDRILKLIDSPYFARIDFQSTAEKEPAVYYIGRFNHYHEKKILIYDWRAPVSSMFYDYELGKAGYQTPKGQVDGELTRKRQFKIKNKRIEYALESSMNVQDDILQRELSHTSDEKMKSIISTIQKEQNEIIRNEKATTLIIQGVAGSGKTSIALHRIAFLMYRFKGRLTAQNITILSPNKVFGDYISNVLPELGEETVYQLGFWDIADIQLLDVIDFVPDRNAVEETDEAWAERVRFKSTLEFVNLMDAYISKLPDSIFEAADYNFAPFKAEAEWIQARFDAYVRYPIMLRLEMVADDIYERFVTENIMEHEMPKLKAIQRGLRAMLKFKSTLPIYKDFYKSIGRSKLFVPHSRGTLEWNDVFPFLYLHAAYAGLQVSHRIKHLVIDEMQDYTPVQYAVINKLFHCPKTILGDFDQSIHASQRYTLEELQQLYDGAEVVRLNKSYRSTYEIINFARKIQPVSNMEPVERHGEKPALIHCGDMEEQISCINEKIAAFAGTGYASLGIITKTNAEAETLYGALQQDVEIHLITPDSKQFVNGISVMSIQMAKGLEFDAVILADAADTKYHTEADRGLLYVACTRAMHKLTLLYTGKISRLLGQMQA